MRSGSALEGARDGAFVEVLGDAGHAAPGQALGEHPLHGRAGARVGL